MGIRNATNINIRNRRISPTPPVSFVSMPPIPIVSFDFSFIDQNRVYNFSPNAARELSHSFSSGPYRRDLERFRELNIDLVRNRNSQEVPPSIYGPHIPIHTTAGDKNLVISFYNWYGRGLEPRIYLLDSANNGNGVSYTICDDDQDGNETRVQVIGFYPEILDILREIVHQLKKSKGNIRL